MLNPRAVDIRALKALSSVLGGVKGANGPRTDDQGGVGGADGVGVLVVADDAGRAREVRSTLAATGEPIAVDATGPAGVDDRLADGTNCVVSASGADVDHELLERVRAVDPTLPFVSLVAEDAAVDPVDALEAGVTDVLERPADDGEYRLVARRVYNYAAKHRCDRSERRLESIFHHSPDAILVHDESGAILDVNARTCEHLGYDREELLELTIQDVEVGIDPEDLDELWTASERGEPVTVEGRHRRADGSTFPVQVNLGRIELPDGEQFLAIARDVTESRRRERELEEARALYGTLVEQSPDGIVIVQDGEYAFVNDGFLELTGYDDESDLLGRSFEAVVAPEYRELVRERYEERIESDDPSEEPPRRYDLAFRTADGDRATADVRVSRIRYEGEPATIATHRDVTDRRRYERELARYEHIVENVPVGVYRSAVGPDGTFEVVNPGMVELFDADDEAALLERPVSDFYVDPADRAVLGDRLGEAGILVDAEVRLRTLEGEERWGAITALRVEEDGEEFFDGVIQDVTERKEAVAELREREAHLRQAQAVATLGSWYTDVPADEIQWSAEVYAIFGRDSEEGPLSHDEFLACVHPDDRAFVERAWEAALEGEPYDIEHRIVVDGETRWVREKGELEFDDEGRPRRAIGVVQDITDRKARERTLEEQNRLLEERADQIEFFNSLLRHDVLNGMTVVRGYADRLLESLPEDDDRHEYAEVVSERASDVVALIQRVRSVLERLTEDDDPSLSPTDLAAVVEDRADALADSNPAATVTVDAPPNAPVLADSFLGDVLENLLHNAVEHHDGDAPHVAVSVEAGPETTTVRVADDGPGVPDDLKDRVFERGETGGGGGTGFGLYFVDVMVAEYGGEVRIEDNDPRGTVVVLELPTA